MPDLDDDRCDRAVEIRGLSGPAFRRLRSMVAGHGYVEALTTDAESHDITVIGDVEKLKSTVKRRSKRKDSTLWSDVYTELLTEVNRLGTADESES